MDVLEKVLGRMQEEKHALLQREASVQRFLENPGFLGAFLGGRSKDEEIVIYSLVLLGQVHILKFDPALKESENVEKLLNLLACLSVVEKSYERMGGLLGYVATLKRCLKTEVCRDEAVCFRMPEGLDIAHDTLETRQATYFGLRSLPEMAEMYPVGGAGDRLNLIDETTGSPLPAARLAYCGHSLLEGLIRDVQGKEYLYYKLFHKQITVPIAMMTSIEKDNHDHILEICEEANYFGRQREFFQFFRQPLVPVLDAEGNFSLSSPLKLFMKPGGHGVLWNLAYENNVFSWLKELGKKKLLLRQINNPMAGIDHGVLAFTGIGISRDKKFGFASCRRLLHTAEGMCVLMEKKRKARVEYHITNVEYTEFDRQGIQDVPISEGSPYSIYPSNTNILFADIDAVENVAKQGIIPGLTVNMKSDAPFLDEQGNVVMKKGGRLESTMQNIADNFIDYFKTPLEEGHATHLQTYITFNERIKTISVTKNAFVPQRSLVGTPRGCFFDLLINQAYLFGKMCKMDLPPLGTPSAFLKQGPPFVILYHPALGPLYSVIAQKVRGGKLHEHAEMQLEIAELDLEEVEVEGSLLIKAKNVLGEKDTKGLIDYEKGAGRCTLKNVTVRNRGVEEHPENQHWRNQVRRTECLVITLEGNSEFYAENVTFLGSYALSVPDHHRMVAFMEEGLVKFRTEKIRSPSWFWQYSVDKNFQIQLEKTALNS